MNHSYRHRRLRLFSARFCGLGQCGAILMCLMWITLPATAQQPSASQLAGAPPAAGDAGSQQPIAYSHRLHAGELQIACVYCHYGARRSSAAGLPAVGVCTGCHRWVKDKTPEMAKVEEYARRGQPIAWKRVNQLDDYVYFSHQRHLASGLGCQGCHGAVQTMVRPQPIERMTMGWCVTCHEQRKAPLDCSTCHR